MFQSSEKWIRLACAAFLLAAPSTANASSPTETTSDAQKLALEIAKAYGGVSKIHALNDLPVVATGTLTEFSTFSGAQTTVTCKIITRNDKSRIETTVMGVPTVSCFDGKTGWLLQGKVVVPVDSTTSAQMQAESDHGLILLEKLEDPNVEKQLGKAQTVNGEECDTLLIKAADGKFSTFCTSRKTHLIVRSQYEGVDAEQGTAATTTYDYSNYRKINDTMVPFKTVESANDKKSSVIVFQSLAVDKSLPDSIFSIPKEKTSVAIKPTTVPFQYKGNEIIVSASVDGKPPESFVVDTGATQSVLDTDLATKYAIKTENGYTMTTSAGTVNTKVARISKLKLGDIEFSDTPVIIMPTNSLVAADVRVGGLIGANILRRYLVSIDYAKRELTLSDPDKVQLAPNAVSLQTMPALGAQGKIIEGELDGKKLTFLVDTGAAVNNVPESVVTDKISHPVLSVGQILGLDGQRVSIGAAMFRTIKIQGFEASNPVFTVTPETSAAKIGGFLKNSKLAILGNPFWSQFKTTVDYRTQRIIIEPAFGRDSIDAAQEKLKKLQSSFIEHQDHKRFCSELETLYKTDRSEDGLKEAIYLAASAYQDSVDLSSGDGQADRAAATSQRFKEAIEKADASKNCLVQSHVRALAALALMANYTPPDKMAATEDMLEAVKLNESDSLLCILLYKLCQQRNNTSQAEKALSQALLLQPDNVLALSDRYEMCKAANKPEDCAAIDAQLKHYFGDKTTPETLRKLAPALIF